MNILMRILSLLGLLLISACAGLGFFAANLPTHFDDVAVQRDIAYGARSDEKLDIYQPPKETAPPDGFPVVIFYYGGRWETGSKDDYGFVASALAQKGFLIVIPDYRKYPAVKFPAFVEDAAAAVAWTADHIGSYGGDAKNINITGHSAGAHIAALLVTDPHYLQAYGKKRGIIKSFVGLAGPYDFVPDEDDLKDMFGPPSRYPQMQATTFVDGKEPPMLLLWGDKDTSVGKQNMDKLAAAIAKKGGCVKTKIYPGIDHIWLVGALSWAGQSKGMVLDDMVDFFTNPSCGLPQS